MIQYPTTPNTFLYRDEIDGSRTFTDCVIRNENTPAWAECTTAEKEQWELEHPAPEPVEQTIEEEV